MFKLFFEGGPWMMSVLTLLLVALFFVAWKAPNWVKETGKAALAFGSLGLLMGINQAAHFIAHYHLSDFSRHPRDSETENLRFSFLRRAR